MTLRKFTVAAFCCLCVFLLSELAYAKDHVRVGGWSMRANGQVAQDFEYTGPCPVELKFTWELISDRPTEIAYTFNRSDGTHHDVSTVTSMPQPGISYPVYYSWDLGSNTPRFANYIGWVNLNVQSPNKLEKLVHFTLHCH